MWRHTGRIHGRADPAEPRTQMCAIAVGQVRRAAGYLIAAAA
jgi:hypothetical protein